MSIQTIGLTTDRCHGLAEHRKLGLTIAGVQQVTCIEANGFDSRFSGEPGPRCGRHIMVSAT